MSDYKKDPLDIGALWVKTSGRGDYMTGKLEIDGQTINVVCFKNDRKQPGSKQPDWRVMKSKPREETAQDQRAVVDVTDAEIPFAWLMPLILPALGLLGSLVA